MSHKEEAELKLSPAADEAMAKLVELFSDPNLPSKPRFRCGVEGPTEFEVWFESISLYRLGLILRITSEWEAPETPEGKSPA